MHQTLIVDNYDSFTHNLVHLVTMAGGTEPRVVANDEKIGNRARSMFGSVIISPGPGRPERERDFGVSAEVIREFELPTLGVCLGHQGLCSILGGRVDLAPAVMHGRESEVFHDGTGLFAGIPSPIRVVRYHSLAVAQVPQRMSVTATTADGTVMAVACLDRPAWGVQFHPESICTEYGLDLIGNFLRLAERGEARSGARRSSIGRAARYGGSGGADEGRSRSRGGRVRSRRLEGYIEPEWAFRDLFGGTAQSFWLDSADGRSGSGRFSYMGSADRDDSHCVSYDAARGRLTVSRAAHREVRSESIFSFLKGALDSGGPPSPQLPFEFTGGYVGYLGYELKAECGGRLTHRQPTPDAAFLYVDRFLAFDHRERAIYLVAHQAPGGEGEVERWMTETAAALAGIGPDPQDGASAGMSEESQMPAPEFHLRHDESRYLELIELCKAHLRAGESYEICLTNVATMPALDDPLETYLALRRVSPAPFAAFMRFEGFAILSASPELFLDIAAEGAVESRPIKGTRPRGSDRTRDEALRRDLATSEKDRAENLMIVDLVRNDLSRVCEPGSVEVADLFSVESYAHVHQLVSGIRGRLRPEQGSVDCVRACFPGGSMTGAPKIRTMEIIDELEEGARGVYSGALGYFGLDGATRLSIVIRTLVSEPNRTTFGVGGAIVWGSEPEEEFEETLVKARAMLGAVAAAGSRDRALVGRPGVGR